MIIGKKGRDHFRRRNAPIDSVLEGVWANMGPEQARAIGRAVLKPFRAGEVDSIYIVYNEFKSAMTQSVTFQPLFPLATAMDTAKAGQAEIQRASSFSFEPSKDALLERLVPMYVEITILRALLESRASFFGAQMTAMDSATKNASELMDKLTLKYNRARRNGSDHHRDRGSSVGPKH